MLKHHMLLCVLLMTMSGQLVAGEQEEAKKAFGRGAALYKENRFAEAGDEFRKAYQLRPSWKILFNIGQCSAAAKEYGLALEAFESYLSQGGDEVPKEKRMDVIEEMRILREMVGYLTVVGPDGASVVVDGRVRGTLPLPGPVPIGTGVNHDLEIRDDNAVLVQRTIRVNSGKTLNMDTNETENPSPVPPTSPTEQVVADVDEHAPEEAVITEDRTKPLRIAGWATAGLGVGALAAMAVTGVKTYSINQDKNPKENDKLYNYQLATNILVGVGSTLTVAGATMLVVAYVSRKRSKENKETSSALMVTPVIAPTGPAISMTVRF